jgi:hypothetical protein
LIAVHEFDVGGRRREDSNRVLKEILEVMKQRG